jgi:mannose-6-phosphate isomerase-like protein (cupin superfamily)
MTHRLVRHLDDGESDRWDDPVRGSVRFHTLFSAETTSTTGLTAGVAELGPGEEFKPHRHPQTEVYLVLSGEGRILVDDEETPVSAGSTVLFPGGRVHAVRNTGDGPLRVFYALDADSMHEVDYRFEASDQHGSE